MSICQRTHLRQSRYISTPIGAIDVLIIKNNKDMMTNLQSSAFVARIWYQKTVIFGWLILGASSAYLRLGCCPAVASHTTRLPIATSSPPYPNPYQEAYLHVRSGNEVVTMDNRHLKNRFSSYQYVKDHFCGRAAIVSRGQTNDPCPEGIT